MLSPKRAASPPPAAEALSLCSLRLKTLPPDDLGRKHKFSRTGTLILNHFRKPAPDAVRFHLNPSEYHDGEAPVSQGYGTVRKPSSLQPEPRNRRNPRLSIP